MLAAVEASMLSRDWSLKSIFASHVVKAVARVSRVFILAAQMCLQSFDMK